MSKLSALVCMSAFKRTLSNFEACQAVGRALEIKKIPFEIFPVGDGGAGTLTSVKNYFNGDEVEFTVSGPLGKKTEARVLCLPNQINPKSLYLESSSCCGLSLLAASGQDAMRASSLGLGELISLVVTKWPSSIERIYVGLGDSAVSDMGMGMLQGLGYLFCDNGGKTIWGSAEGLRHIRTFHPPSIAPWEKIQFTILCDVLTPLMGSFGSARVFSAQKGASAGQINLIEQGMENFANIIEKSGGNVPRYQPMTGAAGGIAAAFLSFLRGELVQGAPFLMDWIQLDRKLAGFDLLITGEGQTDSQTMAGKAPMECLDRAAKAKKKSFIVSGALAKGWETLLRKDGVLGIYECGEKPTAAVALQRKTEEVISKIIEDSL